MKNMIEKLSTYASLVGVVAAIGGGFYAWGEFNTRLANIEGTEAADVSGIVANGEAIASLESTVEGIKIPDVSGIAENSERIAVLEKVETTVDVEKMKENEKKIAVAQKELELLRLEIQELKLKSSNPLAN